MRVPFRERNPLPLGFAALATVVIVVALALNLQSLPFGMPRDGAQSQHAERRRDHQVDSEKDEGRGNRLDQETQPLPARNLGQREDGHAKHQCDGAKCRAPPLPCHHGAQPQKLGLSRNPEKINASHGAASNGPRRGKSYSWEQPPSPFATFLLFETRRNVGHGLLVSVTLA